MRWVVLWIVFIPVPGKGNIENVEDGAIQRNRGKNSAQSVILVWVGGISFSILFFLRPSSYLLYLPSSHLLFLSARVKPLAHSSSAFLGVQEFFCGDGGRASSVSISPVPLVPVLSHQQGEVRMFCVCSRMEN